MATVFTAPQRVVWQEGQPALFLAGSIEMGTAAGWQQQVIEQLADLDIIVLNPRREAWDASWEQR